MKSFLRTVALLWVVLPTALSAEQKVPQIRTKPDTMVIEYQPIGEFHTCMTPQTGAPRQGALEPENEGTIEIYEPFTEALRDIEMYDYIIVLYHMHLSKGWRSSANPPGSKRSFGLFSTRSPNRPNSIGFAVIKLNRVDGAILHVSGIDAFDGTPVLDIKPWISSLDCPDPGKDTEVERKLGISRGKKMRR